MTALIEVELGRSFVPFKFGGIKSGLLMKLRSRVDVP